jgi:hypothetical protein
MAENPFGFIDFYRNVIDFEDFLRDSFSMTYLYLFSLANGQAENIAVIANKSIHVRLTLTENDWSGRVRRSTSTTTGQTNGYVRTVLVFAYSPKQSRYRAVGVIPL